MSITVTNAEPSQPQVVNVGPAPVQLPVTDQGITVVNDGSTLVNVSTDPHLQQGVLPIDPGSSLSLPRAGSYWAMATAPTSVLVLEGNQSYFSTASLQAQGILGASGGMHSINVTAPVNGQVAVPAFGTTPNLILWNIVQSRFVNEPTTKWGISVFESGTGLIIDALASAEGASNRMAGLLFANGSLIVNNSADQIIAVSIVVSPK